MKTVVHFDLLQNVRLKEKCICRCKAKNILRREQNKTSLSVWKTICVGGILWEAQSFRSALLTLLCLVAQGDSIRAVLSEIKTGACPYVLPTPSVLLLTAWLRVSLRMGQCPLIPAQLPSCPGQVSQCPEAVPSMPRLVPDWIPPSNPFQRLFLWIRYAV